MTLLPYNTFLIDANPASVHLSPYLLSFGHWVIELHGLLVTNLPANTDTVCRVTCNLVKNNACLNLQTQKNVLTTTFKYQPLEVLHITTENSKKMIRFPSKVYPLNASEEILNIFF